MWKYFHENYQKVSALKITELLSYRLWSHTSISGILVKKIETIEKSDWENKLWNQSKIKMYIKRQTWFISVQAHLVKLKTGEFSTFSYVHGDSARNNCTKTFVKEVYLELNQTSTRRIFCQKSYWGLVDNYLLRKVHHRW